MKYYAAVQNYVDIPDENLKKVFDDYDEIDIKKLMNMLNDE